MNIFGYRLTQLLNENHLSQTEFAQKINATAPTVSKYCSGRVPNGEIVKQIADFFNVTTDYLYGRVDEPNNSIIYLPQDYEIEIKGDKRNVNKETLQSLIKKLEDVGFDIDKLLDK